MLCAPATSVCPVCTCLMRWPSITMVDAPSSLPASVSIRCPQCTTTSGAEFAGGVLSTAVAAVVTRTAAIEKIKTVRMENSPRTDGCVQRMDVCMVRAPRLSAYAGSWGNGGLPGPLVGERELAGGVEDMIEQRWRRFGRSASAVRQAESKYFLRRVRTWRHA